MRKLLFIFLILVIEGTIVLWAQDVPPFSNEQTILVNINEERRKQNLVPLVTNADLDQIAQQYVSDLASRQLSSLGNVYVLRQRGGSGEVQEINLDNLLEKTTFGKYSDGYQVDFFPAILNGITSDTFVQTLIIDSRQANRTIISRRMSLGQETTLPLFLPLYREIGIGYSFNSDTNRHYYVILVGSQPGVLPVIVTERQALNVIAQTVSTRDVILRIHNENARRFGDRVGNTQHIGAVTNLRVAELPEPLPCPTSATDNQDWQPYKNYLPIQLSAGTGLKTVFVQMCDSQGVTITSSTSVNYVEGQSPELVKALMIAQMTQTAVAETTLYATYQPTVEAILTATAAQSP
ncbi:MAG TPA: hypothetical protein VHO69_12415 [Phototrophicaceae bacterium]|nr:hypothetical protein [Phototrophicaceae bacterium]